MTSRPYAEVIGDPIDHSRSPEIHRFWLDRLGVDADYRATRVRRGELADYLADRRADPAWRGCNVTMPLKLDALLAADTADDKTLAIGAANLLSPRNDGRIAATNFDVSAIREIYVPQAKGSVTVLGGGGAARAALLALKAFPTDPHQPSEIRLQARDLAAARALAAEFGIDTEPRPFDAPIDSLGLINATPVGMAGVPLMTFNLSAMPANGWVFDMVSTPLPTPLIEDARANGLRAIDGLSMLVKQAASSFGVFFGAKWRLRGHFVALHTKLRS